MNEFAPAAESAPVRVHAAGSLRRAFGELAEAMASDGLPPADFTFGAAGLLKARVRDGEACDLFASANLAHAEALAEGARPVRVFARNRLCALARAGLRVTPSSLLDRMLDPAIRLGTSTPRADPSGDYALEVFDKAERFRPGARDRLAAKAAALTGGPTSAASASSRSVYSEIMARQDADIFLTYVTNALVAVRETPGATIVELPTELAVMADYGLVVLSPGAPANAIAEWILSPTGQGILTRHGFERTTC